MNDSRNASQRRFHQYQNATSTTASISARHHCVLRQTGTRSAVQKGFVDADQGGQGRKKQQSGFELTLVG
eukprot:3998079-Alexandrium_andersonii.AAC.1